MKLSKYNKPTSNMFVQLIRYGISGGLAFFVDFGVMVLLYEIFNIPEAISGTISFGIGLIITYILSIFWIFDKRRVKNRLAEFTIFGIIGVIGLLMTYVLMTVFSERLDMNYMLAKIATTVIVTFWNFVAKKIILFRA